MSQKGSRSNLAIAAEQLRAARALLGWSQTELANQAGMSLPTVKRVETERGPKVSEEARLALQRALVLGGVEFIDQNGGGPGVRLRKSPKRQKIGSRVQKRKEHQMDILTRRGFLGSLAFGSIYPNVEQFPASQLQAVGGEAHPSKILWSIAKRNLVAHLDHVDFWSKPRCAIKYADQLPSEIGRGALFYGEAAELSAKSALTRVDAMSLEKEYASLNDRFSFQHGTGIRTLAELLRARVDANAKSSRVATTALIALDSQWSTPPGPDWTDILSVFRGCYDRLIGHYHINQTGISPLEELDDRGRV